MQPVHFEDLPRAVQVQLVAGGAFLFGLVCGFVLSEGKTGWIILQLIAAVGGFLAGSIIRARARARCAAWRAASSSASASSSPTR